MQAIDEFVEVGSAAWWLLLALVLVARGCEARENHQPSKRRLSGTKKTTTFAGSLLVPLAPASGERG